MRTLRANSGQRAQTNINLASSNGEHSAFGAARTRTANWPLNLAEPAGAKARAKARVGARAARYCYTRPKGGERCASGTIRAASEPLAASRRLAKRVSASLWPHRLGPCAARPGVRSGHWPAVGGSQLAPNAGHDLKILLLLLPCVYRPASLLNKAGPSGTGNKWSERPLAAQRKAASAGAGSSGELASPRACQRPAQP